MKGRTWMLLASLMFVVALMVMTSVVPAMELPKGVSFKVLAEFPSKISGIEKVQLQELRLEPGAKWENITVGDTGF